MPLDSKIDKFLCKIDIMIKIKVILSEKYSYQPDGWATLISYSDPNIKCPLCFERMRYTDTERNHLTRFNCVYTSVLWEEAKTLAEQDQE